MLYRVIGVYLSSIYVTFCEDNEERTFDTLDGAQRYLEMIKAKKVLPNNYELVIEQIETDEAPV